MIALARAAGVVLGMPDGVAIALIGAVGAVAGVWGSRRSSADSVAVQRDQNTWERMESLLAERDRTIERLEERVRELERQLSRPATD